jgi:energy-coupling factor transporter ATP-binding protein EcfA2
MTIPTTPRFGLPRVLRVQLHAFSLYSLDPNISLTLDKGVTCLAGANGIGKSTYLSTINYALTGVVPDPAREFLSATAYFAKAKDYTGSFFDGRITEIDRDSAAVSIDFNIRERQYFLKRSLFEIGTISELRILENGKDTYDSKASTPEQNEAHYRTDICAAIGLNSFEQFVMLQHFLFTFDEGRHLIFWDRPVSSALLYVCFGGDPQDAAKADRLNREMEKAGSRGRNIQFQANNLSKRIDTLEQSISAPADATAEVEAAVAEYAALNAALAKAMTEAEEADVLANDAELKVMEASASVVTLRTAYTRAFEDYVNGAASPERHPLIASSISECQCPICQSSGQSVVDVIRAKINAGQCPLCTSSLSRADGLTTERSAALGELDKSLAVGKRILEAAVAAKTRLTKTANEKRDLVKVCRSAVNAFDEANRASLEGIQGKLALLDGPLAQTLSALRTARTDQIAQRDLAYGERDALRDELRVLQRSLERKYIEAESTFVPLFKRLAQAFLGVDLDISLITGAAMGLNLQIEMRGNARRKQSQLSESQRFFVDIALRMALAQYVSDPASPATLFIDTPEGSLDIAYEDRAGQMFAEFVKSGHAMIMTANINSSKLLTTLAQACGAGSMSIVQMTHWTELSDVQRGAEGLFRAAFADIEAALSAPEGV